MRIAYLTNAYPKISHSFIRREITALEQLGVEVVRISVRPTAEILPGTADEAEQARTIALLHPSSLLSLIFAMLRESAASPRRFVRAMVKAWRLGQGSSPGLLRHLVYFAEACKLSGILRERQIPHVHVHFGTNPATVALISSALTGVTYSMTVHGPDEFDDPRGLRLPDKIAGGVLTAAVSSFGRGQLLRWAEPQHWDRIHVVRCGVDDVFLEHAANRMPEGNRFVCVARLSAQKGLPLLVEAAGVAKDAGATFEIRVIGDGELRSLIEAMVADRGVADCFTLLGWLSAEEIRTELIQSRAFVLPSLAEGLPVVLMEAMALRRPVIATAIAGIPELVDRECGWLVPAGSAEALASAMAQALDTPLHELARLGEEGRRRVVEQHDVRRNTAELLQRLRPCLSLGDQ
ncbi:glycosyltransferase [Sphingomonas lutea]|uniref:Glycosyltransferase n=1 Tax=Sphingomonas lutea TaxID=1045317 RepID=A0A7G9SH06_9SPHN|nr:glycosyltransferase [Sphingomonas lutea]QNN67131.1 glycosyltransferase [Sphingomonas lutea]